MKKQHWILVVIGLLLIGGWFYWYQYRPSQIRKDCYGTAKYWAGTYYTSKNYPSNFDFHYTQCLRNHGLTK